jgi:uncharacterized repeat protein (TIGR01451 family)
VGKAQISIEKAGPATAVLNSDVTYNITVRNSGSLAAKDVVVTDTIPAGMTHSSGQKTVTFNVGELAPNQSKQIPITLKATAKGKHCNTAQVSSSNAGKANSEACTTVLVPGLKVVKTGTKEQFLTRNATYDIKVSNTGDTPLTGVVVTDTAPAGTTVVSASAGGTVSGNTVTWNVGELGAGQEKSFSVVLTSKVAGNLCNSVSVATTQGLRETSQACTVWRGVSALLLEKADNPDPIQVGENTKYTVMVTNQGTADDSNIVVGATLGEQQKLISVDTAGAKGVAHTVTGQVVKFAAVPLLHPGERVSYKIVVEAAAVGDVRFAVELKTDQLTSTVNETESTNQY